MGFFLIRIENNIDLYSELCFFKNFFKNAVERQNKINQAFLTYSVHTERNKITTVKNH